jgi:hypothetical protein
MFKVTLALLAVLFVAAAPAHSEMEYQVTPDGVVMEATIDEADFSEFIESIPERGGVTVCFNSTSTLGIDWFWTIDVVRSGGVVNVLGGFISGTICDSPNWDVTGGTITGTSMSFSGVYVGSSSCADVVELDGSRTPPGPRVWSGLYGFPAPSFPHDTAFAGFGPC